MIVASAVILRPVMACPWLTARVRCLLFGPEPVIPAGSWTPESSPSGVRVNAIAPGPVFTAGAAPDRIARLGRDDTLEAGRPADAAYFAGATIAADGGRRRSSAPPGGALADTLRHHPQPLRIGGYVVLFHNIPRTQNGHIRNDTRDVSRRILGGSVGPICRENCVASDRACTRVTPQNLHGKEGVDGSSPSEGFDKMPANLHFSVVYSLNSGHISDTSAVRGTHRDV